MQSILSKARRHSKKIVCLITDGFSNGEKNPLPIAEKLKSDNVTIITFGIQSGNFAELYKLSSEPRDEHSFLLNSFSEFESLARKALHTGFNFIILNYTHTFKIEYLHNFRWSVFIYIPI